MKTDITTEICIVGSGIGGATLAMKLAEKGHEILIVEAGGRRGNSNIVTYENVGRELGLRATTSIQLGGTSNLWHGVLSMLDPIDFRKREWIEYSGWPISLGDLSDAYAEASELYSIKSHKNFFLESLENRFTEEINRLTINKDYVENKLFQQPIPAKRFKDDLLDLAKKNEKVRILNHTVGLELKTSDNGNSILSLLAYDKYGKELNIRATWFILAAGALETPRLLLNSNEFYPDGLGNNHDKVGRFLMDHPMGNLLQIQFQNKQEMSIYSDTKYAKNQKIKTGLVLTESLQEKYRLPNHNFYLRPSFVQGIDNESEKIKLAMLTFLSGKLTIKDLFRVVTNFNVVLQLLTYKFTLKVNYRYADLFFVTEQIPNPQSRVMLSNTRDRFGYRIARINWQVTDKEISAINKWNTLLRKHIFNYPGYKFTHSVDDVHWEKIFTSAAHHVGTARMSDNQKDGVVDRNLKVFDISNLYICDGSVFTTSGNVNSGFTISALACRLARHIDRIK